jgi:hypothetical protein
VRIAVARLDDLLLVGELAAQVHLVVAYSPPCGNSAWKARKNCDTRS